MTVSSIKAGDIFLNKYVNLKNYEHYHFITIVDPEKAVYKYTLSNEYKKHYATGALLTNFIYLGNGKDLEEVIILLYGKK